MNDLQKIGAGITGLGCLILLSPVALVLLIVAFAALKAAITR